MSKKQPLPKLKISNNSRGFTLVEVMIAMVIFTVGILSVAAMQTSATKGNTTANRTTRSFMWCSDRMEILKSLPYNTVALGGGLHQLAQNADGVDNDYDGQIDEAGESGAINIEYTVVEDAALLNTKTITVEADWQTSLGRQKRFTLSTVRARNATAE
jgi:prepilin-type N-terminal cleavage/methylation domain-containing protein